MNVEFNEKWEEIRDIFEERLGMPRYIADYVAVFDVLVMTLAGLSVENIAKDTDLDEYNVKNILNEFLEFNGWEQNQNINYWFVYNQTDTKEGFAQIIQNLSKYGTINIETEKVYSMCTVLADIRNELNEWYN